MKCKLFHSIPKAPSPPFFEGKSALLQVCLPLIYDTKFKIQIVCQLNVSYIISIKYTITGKYSSFVTIKFVVDF